MSSVAALAGLASANTDNPVADFSDTPLWLSLVKALIIFVYLLVSTLLVIWFERRVIGRMQQRPGPNRNGPFGLLQTLADGMKSMLKEDVRPKAADALVFTIAPLITAACPSHRYSPRLLFARMPRWCPGAGGPGVRSQARFAVAPVKAGHERC